MNIEKKRVKYDKLLISISMALVLIIVAFLALKPEASQNVASKIFGLFTDIFGSGVLLFTFLGILLLIGITLSKYGSIRLGTEKPEYSTFKWVAMMICCGLGAATVYWAFMEWAYYIGTPGIGIEPGSTLAYEMSVTYTMFHWGVSAWTLYALAAIPVCYHFYVRKNGGLSFSSVVSSMTGIKADGILGRIIDVIFIFTCFGGLSITLGVSVPLVTQVICSVIGMTPTFTMNIILIVIISVIYSFSSYIGIQKGMSKLADWNTKLAILFCILILLMGPTLFIMKNCVNSFGLMIQNFVRMSLYTDPVQNNGFPESWTIFYWLYWIAYAPFTALFIAKVSKGRTIRSVIINTLVSGSCGCFFFFGILGSFAMERQVSSVIPVVDMLSNGLDKEAIVEMLQSLPGGNILLILFAIITIFFLATTLDGAAFTMASTATPGLKNNEEPHPIHRLFWCAMLALVPLTMIMIGANLNTIKTCAVATAVPLVFIMIVMLHGWLKWMMEDYANKNSIEIAEEFKLKKDDL
ncbi:MAG: BCCT family transporter [Tepidibacter sp.]|jgi:BCCT family betaine/carnitine transporter|uniref:BCCT family transporter n=1 Tax=Tepidibacter sp. TaxID=2529387 RepID=UPI0025F340E2|nr:BCCT family transporter [Tepidibacter sp.]MCT4509590.1 BCCT family transporter [Tepidibacter sp.]